MNVKSETIKVSTNGFTDVIDITDQLSAIISRCEMTSGIATTFVVGSTAGLTTIEFEPGLTHDIQEAFEKVAPKNGQYRHHERWGDDNGHSHVRASLLGPV